MSALVVGSMMPDFQYFLSMKLNGRFSHTLAGLFLFDLPVGILIWILFHRVVRQSLIDNVPGVISSRLQVLRSFDFRKYLQAHPVGLAGCILIGAASHILWDGFTHHDGMFVPLIPQLNAPVGHAWFPDVPLFRYLQHASTVAGAFFIIYAFFQLPVRPVTVKPKFGFWFMLVLCAMPAFLLRSWFGIEYYGDLIVILISSFFVGLIAASLMRPKSNRT